MLRQTVSPHALVALVEEGREGLAVTALVVGEGRSVVPRHHPYFGRGQQAPRGHLCCALLCGQFFSVQ